MNGILLPQACLQAEDNWGIIRPMKKSGYWTGAHTKHRLKYHVVWIPKYRKRVLRGELAQRLRELIIQCAEINGWHIEEIKIMHNHVHLLIQVLPTRSLAYVIQLIKGGTSRVIRKEFPELEEFLWGDSLWADGYFAETIGMAQEEMIRRYIKEQHV